MALAASGKEMLQSGDADVKATAARSGSTMVTWIDLVEFLAGAVIYMSTKNLKYFSGFIVVSVLIAVGIKIARY